MLRTAALLLPTSHTNSNLQCAFAMGCGSSSPGERGESEELDRDRERALEVLLKFPCAAANKVSPRRDMPQLVVGRITGLVGSLTSPYSCRKCALYRVDCYWSDCQDRSLFWRKIYSETRAVSFELRHPNDPSMVVYCPAKLLSIQYHKPEVFQSLSKENFIELEECTPSIRSLLSRSGIDESDLSKIRIIEHCVEENTQVGVFGVAEPNSEKAIDEDVIRMKPLQSEFLVDSNFKRKNSWSELDKKRYSTLACGGRGIVIVEDCKYMHGLNIKPFAGQLPRVASLSENEENFPEATSGEQNKTKSVGEIREPAGATEIRVQIPKDAVPGSKIPVPGPRGSRIVHITVPNDFKPGDMHIFNE